MAAVSFNPILLFKKKQWKKVDNLCKLFNEKNKIKTKKKFFEQNDEKKKRFEKVRIDCYRNTILKDLI